MRKQLYLSNNHLMSYGCHVMAEIGARGIGKTYNKKKYVLKQFIFKGRVFAWLRDNENALKEVMDNNGAKWFKDVIKDPCINKHLKDAKIVLKDGILTINGKLAGYFMACSTFYKLKGNDYQDIDIIVYDEFIAEKTQAIRGNRAWEFQNMLETIGRLRKDFKVFLTANALDRGDELLNYLLGNIKLTGFGYYVDHKRSVVVHYAENSPAYVEQKKQSIAGRLALGTIFEDNLINNVFTSTKVNLFDRKPKGTFLLAIFRDSLGRRIRIDIGEDNAYCSIDKNELANKDKHFVTDISLVNIDYALASNDLINGVVRLAGTGHMYFDSELTNRIFLNVFTTDKKSK